MVVSNNLYRVCRICINLAQFGVIQRKAIIEIINKLDMLEIVVAAKGRMSVDLYKPPTRQIFFSGYSKC